MDAITTILVALASGAAAAAQDTASQVVKDAYAGLKALVQRKLQAKDPNAATIVSEYEKDAATWEKPMQKALDASGAASDDAMLEQAHRVLQVVQQSTGKFNVQVSGDVQGQVVGDHAVQHNVFGRE